MAPPISGQSKLDLQNLRLEYQNQSFVFWQRDSEAENPQEKLS